LIFCSPDKKDNANATFIGVDTGRSELIEALVDATLNKHERLDYAVNNAAVGNTSAQIPEINEEEWDRVLDINQTGVWAGMKYELPALEDTGGGAIVNVSSKAGLRGTPEEAESFCQRYNCRWQIEGEYKSIKGDFLAKTSSKDYRIRLFYFVFAVLLYNIWRLTDFLLKAGVGGEMDYAPVLTAGECVELIASSLIPHD